MASLKYGSKGTAVKEIQTRLKELGYYSGDINGNYLLSTKDAVKTFQASNKLVVDGICGAKTKLKLFSKNCLAANDVNLVKGDRGEKVKEIQKRLKDLGYLFDKVDGVFGNNTKTAVEEFQSAVNITITGKCDTVTYAKLIAPDAPKSSGKRKPGSTCEPAHGTAQKMDWWTSNIQTIFAKEVIATITDVATGISWKEIRKAGHNHADVQPCTAADTKAFKKACKKWSWGHRAIFVTIKGINYAASMNCQPHGGSSVKNNNFPGHHCIHFTNSRLHNTNKISPYHQKQIEIAAETTLP